MRTVVKAYQVQESALQDKDNDTKVQVEESADEDKIRFDTAGAERMIIDNSGNVGIRTASPATELHLNGSLTFTERSSDPTNPAEGNCVLWMSNGAGSGDDGDIIIKITAGGSTKTVTLVDFSAS